VIPLCGAFRFRGYDMDATSTLLERHERGIHSGPYGGAGVTKSVLAAGIRTAALLTGVSLK